MTDLGTERDGSRDDPFLLFMTRFAVLFVIASCIPPAAYYSPSQPRWQQGPTTNGTDDSNPYGYDADDNTPPPQRGDGGAKGGQSSTGPWWLCRAEGSVGTSDGGSWSYSKEMAFGSAANRDDAYMKAIEDCNALVRMSATLASARDVRHETESCRVVDCMGQR